MLVRRRAAVMFVDVCNYSGMVAQDELVAVLRMLRLREETIEPLVEAFEGHVVDYAGDGALIEFNCVVLAMRCAVAMQQELMERERDVDAAHRFVLRIGIDIGEVLAHRKGIAGSHVNIASRLEELAAPGGICLSDDAYQLIDKPLAMNCNPGGKYLLKNIKHPVEVWFFGGMSFWQRPRTTHKVSALASVNLAQSASMLNALTKDLILRLRAMVMSLSISPLRSIRW